jgi:17beta-estradiol 17-dehydrogenase / very-long-chain 3-oxoacyl-CoA reductase
MSLDKFKDNNAEPWAIVTGGSDGIGRGYVEELLSRGFNVIIHGRSKEKLTKLKAELQTEYSSRSIELVVADASNVEPAVAAIIESGANKHVTILVNNVYYQSSYTSFKDQSSAEIDAIINVGVRFTLHLTHALIPILETRSNSLIINMGGLTSEYPAPYLSVYSGTKSFLKSYTYALSLELPPTSSITIKTYNIHNVSSSANRSSPSLLTPTSRTMAKACLNSASSSGVVVTPYWTHNIMNWVLWLIPRRFMDSMLTKRILQMKEAENNASNQHLDA